MYRDQKPPESIKTTETHTRTHQITLGRLAAHQALTDMACRQVGIDPRQKGLKADVYVWRPAQTGPNSDLVYEITITEDLSKPAITDFAPTNIEDAVRLNPPATPGLNSYDGTAPWCSSAYSVPLNTTATSSRENVEAIERMKKEQPTLLKAMDINARYTEIKTGIGKDLWMEDLMKRVNKLHDVLLHGKGNNIVLSPGEVDTVLEYINVGALALDKVKISRGSGVGYAETNIGNQGKGWNAVPPYTTPMNLPLPEGASVLSAARGV